MDFDAARKQEEERVRAVEREEARIQRQREAAISADTLRSIKQAYAEAAAPETTAARKDNSSFKEYMTGAIRQRAELIQLSRTEAEIRGIITTKYEGEIEKAALTNRIRQAGKQGLIDEVRVLEQQLQLVNQINQQLSKQPKPKQTSAEIAAGQRQHTMDRLFGDGGASLMAIQAGLMANYAVLGTVTGIISDSMQFTADFDNQLRNIQAITVTTDENMAKLKQEIIGVSQATHFMATDVASAALILGQAGLSTKEIGETLKSIATLATATGTDLGQSVDVATSVIGVFNMDATQMGHVADTLTTAVNKTKLNIDKLALGLQYAGNTAADSNVSFEETTATLGAMANAGIRSGSTLGTGLRQILIALEKPSTEFKATLDKLGISMADIDLRSNGLYGALKNLKDGGFTASDAMRSFEVRAAAAYNAVAGNLDSIVTLEREFANQGAAAKANETQMQSMTNTWNRFKSATMVLISEALQPLMFALRDIVSATTEVINWLGQFPVLLKTLTTGVVALGVAFGAVKLTTLTLGLGQLVTGMIGATTAAAALETAALTTGVAMSTMLGPIGLIATALAGLAWYSYTSEVNRASEAMEKARTAFDNAMENVNSTKSAMDMVEEKMRELSGKSGMLAQNHNLLQLEAEKVRSQFMSNGIVLGEQVSSVNELTGALQNLFNQLQKEYVVKVTMAKSSVEAMISQLKMQNRNLTEDMPGGWRTEARMASDPKALDLWRRGSRGANNSLIENQEVMTGLNQLIGAYQDAGISESSWTVQGGVLKDLLKLQENLGTIIQNQNETASLQNQLLDQQRTIDNTQNLQKNQGVASQVQNFSNNARARVLGAAEGATDKDAIAQYYAANSEASALAAEAEKLLKSIKENTYLTDDNRAQLSQLVENSLAAAEAERDKLSEAALDVAKSNAKVSKQLNEAKDKNLEAALGRTTSEDGAYNITGQRVSLAWSTYNAGVGQLAIEHDPITDKEAYEAGLRDLEAERDAQLNQVRADVLDRVKMITDLGLSSMDRTIAAVEAEIKKTGPKDFEKRTELYEKLIQAQKDRTAEAIQQVQKTVLDPLVRQGEEDKLNDALKIALDDIAERMKVDTQMKVADLVENAKIFASTAEADMSQTLGKATTVDQVNAITNQRYDLSKATFNAEQQGLTSQLQGGQITQDNFNAQLTALLQQQKARDEAIRTDAGRKIAQIMSNKSEELELTIRDIELKLRQTGELDFEKRKQLLSDLESATVAKYDQEEAAIAADVSKTFEEKSKALKELSMAEAEALQSIVEQKAANDVAAAQAALEQTDIALDNVMALAEKTTSLSALNGLMKQAMQLIAQRAAQAKAVADADTTDGIFPGKMEDDHVDRQSEIEKAFARFSYNIKKYGHAGGRTFGGGAGGGGGDKGKSPEELMVEQMEQRVKTVETLLKARLLDGATGVTQINQIVADTKGKVAELDAKIAGMQSKVNGGQMSKEDLEHLNDLLKAREGLTKNAAAAEMMLTEEMAKQGKYWEAAKHFTTNWAKENLDIGKTFTQGLGSVLSSLTSGFATLFTELSDGSVSAGQAFRNFAVTAIKAMMQMIAQMLAVYAMQKLIGMVFPGAQAPGSFGAFAQSWAGMQMGGVVRKADGGHVKGNLPRDSKLHLLMPDEYVLRKSAVQAIGVDKLDQLNALGNRKMASGGHVGAAAQRPSSLGLTNVYVVSPEQKPVPGPNDIIAIIGDDIARGGPTKKLIKSVSMGF